MDGLMNKLIVIIFYKEFYMGSDRVSNKKLRLGNSMERKKLFPVKGGVKTLVEPGSRS